MSACYSDRVLAFAGIVQACQCAQHIARSGMADTAALTTCINSLFIIDADNCREVFQAGDQLQSGILTSIELLSRSADKERNELMRYIISVIQLERTVHKQPQMLQQVSAGISRAQQQIEHFSLLHTNVLASLADLYAGTLSTLKPRIMINGDEMLLTHPDNINKIRCCLLAAIRSAVLWRQTGGSRLQLLFSRKRYLDTLKTL